MQEVISFIVEYKFVILFYLLIITFFIIKRKNVDVQAKIIFLYRMKWGLKWMDKYASKLREWLILFGYIGVGAGYIGLIFISYILIKNLYTLITQPAAVSGVSLVLPGIHVPGLGILSFWYWLIAIFLIALVHEFAHGIIARAHKIPVKNTGLALFGPILGAFVEPDETYLRKQKDIAQYSVLAAGSFSNILLALLSFILLIYAFMPLQEMMTAPTGFTFEGYYGENMPFAQAGIKPGTLITGINGVEAKTFQEFNEELSFHKPGEAITIKTADKDYSADKEYSIVLAKNPENPKVGFLGIKDIKNEYDLKEEYKLSIWKYAYFLTDWLAGFLRWLFLLSLGIGLFNLLPLPIVDGGRITQVFLHKLKGPVEGEKRYRQISMFFLMVLLLNLVYPFLAKMLGF